MGYQSILTDILNKKGQNGVRIVTRDDHIGVFLVLKNFDLESDTMERNDFVEYGQIVGHYLLLAYPEIIPQGQPNYGGPEVKLKGFTPQSLRSAYLALAAYQWKEEDLKSRWVFERTAREAERLLPLANFFYLLSRRVLDGGRFSPAEMERMRRKRIKAELDPGLDTGLMEMTELWRKRMFDDQSAFFRLQKGKATALMIALAYREPVLPVRAEARDRGTYNRRVERITSFLDLGIITGGGKEEPYVMTKMLVLRDRVLGEARDCADRFYYEIADRLRTVINRIGLTFLELEELFMQDHGSCKALIRFAYASDVTVVFKTWFEWRGKKDGALSFEYGIRLYEVYDERTVTVVGADWEGLKEAIVDYMTQGNG